MTVKEAQRELERIADELDKAIAQLIESPAAAGRWPATLRSAAEALQETSRQFPRTADRGATRPLLRAIRRRMMRVESLLESAALFYCGCLAVPAAQAYSYAPDGALESFATRGRIRLEA